MYRLLTACVWIALAAIAGAQSQPSTRPVGALRMAVINADLDRVVELLGAGVGVDFRDEDGATALHYAAAFNRRKIVELLLSRGAEIDARDAEDRTPLHLAAFGGCADTTLLLLERGADAHAVDTGGFTPLHAAGGNREEGRRGTARIVRLLIERGDADVNAVSGETGATPLHVAASSNNPAVADALLDAGAEIDATDDAGRTPLHVAAACGWHETVQVLLDRKAAIAIRDGSDRLPSDLAEANGHADIAKTLRNAAAKGPL
jgi:ankyrin repeat protein